MYEALRKYDSLDLIDNTDDCACAIFFLAGLKEMGNDKQRIASAFDANFAKVQVLLSYAIAAQNGVIKGVNNNGDNKDNEEKEDETH